MGWFCDHDWSESYTEYPAKSYWCECRKCGKTTSHNFKFSHTKQVGTAGDAAELRAQQRNGGEVYRTVRVYTCARCGATGED